MHYIALGDHGQYIYISPEKDLIIVRFGDHYGSQDKSNLWIRIFYEFASTYYMAGPAGFEPAVSGSGGRCIIHYATGPLTV